MTGWLPVESPHSHSTAVVKQGKSTVGKQHYCCQNCDCAYRTLVLTQTEPRRTRQVLQQIVAMTLNRSGDRDIAQMLHLSPTTVTPELKQTRTPQTSESEAVAVTQTGGGRGRYYPCPSA